MDMLSVDVLPPAGHEGDDEASEDHALLRLHVSPTSLQDGSDDASGLAEDDGAEYDASQTPNTPQTLRSGARRRRKIGKTIQLILLRKYVQCAKQFSRIPDRLTTEQLLEQGYDEFYYQGGNLNEPRLSYAAFLKLVRNRRNEAARQTRGTGSLAPRGGTRRHQKEQMEIRTLIDELEQIRHGQPRGSLEYDALGPSSAGNDHPRSVMTDAAVPILSDSSSIMDAGTDGGVSAGDLSTAETYSSVMSGTDSSGDDVVVSRSKLDLILRVAQETLLAQKKILEEHVASASRLRIESWSSGHTSAQCVRYLPWIMSEGAVATKDLLRSCAQNLRAEEMADLIEKIGRFFAQQESQIQETYTQATKATPRAQLRPPPPVHKIPVPLSAQSPVFARRSLIPSAVSKLPRNNPLAHRRLAVKSAAELTVPLQSSECPVQSINQILDGVQLQSNVHDIPSLSLSAPRPMARNLLPREDIWSHNLSGGVVSWKSSSSPVSTSSSRGSSFKEDDCSSQPGSDVNERPRKPRPPQQKNRKRLRKKKSKRSGNQEDDQPDPRAVAKANAEKVAAALALAQERAARFQQDKLQLDRERELERQEAALRLQEQMMRIEAVRASSFRHSSSTMTTARSSLSYCDPEGNSHETESVWTADSNDVLESHKPPSEFMAGLEAQIREKMSLEMHVKHSYIEKHKQRERVRLKLDKLLQQNAVQSSKVARLSAMKASLEMELAAVLEDTAQTRQQRRELELADEKERLRRQRDAERALQIRLREEEWASMVEEERERSQVAAEARAKASKRVEAHSAQLRKMLQAYRYEPRHSTRSELLSSTHINNNDGDHGDTESYASDKDFSSKPVQPFKMDFFLPPELADFEEDGLCDSKDDLPTAVKPNNNESSEDCAKAVSPPHCKLPKSLPFQWQVPKFTDQIKFTQVLLDMVSDDED